MDYYGTYRMRELIWHALAGVKQSAVQIQKHMFRTFYGVDEVRSVFWPEKDVRQGRNTETWNARFKEEICDKTPECKCG